MSAQTDSPAKASGESIEQFGYKQELRRGMTLRDVVLYGVLFMVIIAPQSIYGEIQIASGGMTPLVYIVGFVAISFTAMSYMRMSKRFPIAGSVYSYVQRGINPHVGFMAGWLILLDYVFVPSLLLVMVANWGVALVPGSPWYLWVVVFVVFNTFVNIRGIQMTKGVDWVIFVVEILAVIAFIAIGTSFVLGGGGAGQLTIDPIYQPGKVDAHFIATAVSIACLSFLGFDGMSTLAEETVKPEKTIGKGILIALCIMVVVFVAQTYVAALIQPDVSQVDPEMGFFNAALMAGGPVLYKLLLVVNIVAVGIANIMNAQLASSRLLYSMGRDGVIPRIFGKVHPKFQTPYIASIALGVVSLILPMFLDMTTLVAFVNFGALSSFVLLNFAVFLFFFVKEKKRSSFGDVVKYLICPWLGIFILVYVFTGFDLQTYAVGISWMVIGLIIGAVKSKGYKEVPEAFRHLEV
ncbi:MAG: Putrescine importer PuuP [Paraeggerthella hongkongensis]|uniref:APC family permease n=1 Tax=Paraeggerthella TaxID=651554 RepID=UPI001C101EB8|nr:MULTISPECIES: APC family permease [Paraeggerthella]MBU5405350.1 APC family permease [Paraeggerthella hongkongensis]MCD2432529.1 APC family permease [Paraeggerthella hominis]